MFQHQVDLLGDSEGKVRFLSQATTCLDLHHQSKEIIT